MRSRKPHIRILLGACLLINLTLMSFVAAPLVAAAEPATLADFEPDVPGGWYVFSGGGGWVTPVVLTVPDGDPLARPGQVGPNNVLDAAYDVTGGWAGFGVDFGVTTGPQDWSDYTAFSFWFYGSGTGEEYQAEISDNSSDGTSANAERFDYNFVDDFAGWQQVVIPFAEFTRATDYQPPGAPDDGLTLTEMWGWAMVLQPGTLGDFYLDDVAVGFHDVDDFESGLPAGLDPNGLQIGFYTFAGPDATVSIATTDSPPDPVPGKFGVNNVLQVDTYVPSGSWAGLVHAFENEGVDTWTPQDWSTYVGIAFWLYGNGTGSTLFVDVLDNRNPGSIVDDAERFSIDIPDDFAGWQFFQIPFEDFHRKEIGNGAPNDGFTLTEVHGWAFGVFSSELAFTNYVDDVSLWGTADIPELAVRFSTDAYTVDEGGTATVTVELSRPLGEEGDPDQVTVGYTTDDGSATADRDYYPAAGELTFVSGGPAEQSFTVQTMDDLKFEGGETVVLWLNDPVGAPLAVPFEARIDIVDDEAHNPALIDDFEQPPYLWDSSSNVSLSNPEIAAGDPMALPGQGAFEHVLSVEAQSLIPVEIDVQGRLCNQGSGVVSVVLLTTGDFDATTVDHTTAMLGNARETHVDKKTGEPRRHEEDADGDGDIDLVFHFRFEETGLPCDSVVTPFTGWTFDGQPVAAGGARSWFGRDFALGQDWSYADGLRFWFYGRNTGETYTVDLLDNRAPDPGPGGWDLVWSQEFDEPAGTPPDPEYWTHEVGDGTVNGIPGWGNGELEYYTDSVENAATDGMGNLVITAREADGSLLCYYGPCDYTSARLISADKAEFAYGRIEARIQVPYGEGLWPAFWSLGNDIGVVGWPQSGEIDIMEFVGREPYEVFGTIHGPGYSGGSAFGNTYTFGDPVSDDYHTFALEWGPDEIHWYVDGINYHNAAPADVAPNEWVFNHPFFLIMNVAVGGNFGGPIGEDTEFPQEMLVDYVRVYQGPDTAERFEATFNDDFEGWQEVTVPFSSFVRSDGQPVGAPDDGLGLTEVWGYGFTLANGTSAGPALLDQVRLDVGCHPMVTNTGDSGPGSLRQAIAFACDGGVVTFDPGLAGGTIALSTGPLWVTGKTVNIDGSGAPGITVSGSGIDRVFIIDPGATANINDLTIADGFGWQLAGGILNNGNLSLDHVTVIGNVMATDSGDFWQGGGGIYNGAGATLNLIDSSVTNNTAAWSGGGVYSFWDTYTSIVRSTISGNVSGDVGGAIRMLGDAQIVNSTISDNQSTGWYGGAIFHTDGVMEILNSTIAENMSPDWGQAAVFVGTFNENSPDLILTNTIVGYNAGAQCIVYWGGAGVPELISGGHNIASDGTCNLTSVGDLPNTDPMIGGLADNGGPTWTHALLADSPAIDAGDDAVCPDTDQRGVARPQGAHCDIGAYEYME